MHTLNEKVTIGIDVSKDKLDIGLYPQGLHQIIVNSPQAIKAWIRSSLSSFNAQSMKVALEPTGGYENHLIKNLLEKGIKTFYIHPNRLLHYGKSEGNRAKTDKIASQLLAQFMAEKEAFLTPIHPGYLNDKALRELSSRRRQIKGLLQRERCRKHHTFFHPEIKRSLQRTRQRLEKELDRIELVMDQSLANDPQRLQQIQVLTSFKGIGKKTAQMLVTDLPELGCLNRGQISRLIGVAPLNRDSGKKKGHRFIRGGREYIRQDLYMPALSAIRSNPIIRQHYQHLCDQGKPAKVAIMAIIRKMICTLNARIRDFNLGLVPHELIV